MNSIIMAGPMLTADPSSSRFYSVLTLNEAAQLATVEINMTTQTNTLRISRANNTDVGPILAFLVQVAKQYKGQSIVAKDEHAVTFVMALTNTIASTDPQIVEGWTKLNFTVEATQASTSDLKSNSVRFVGTNIQGLKAISSASAITFTITAK